MEHVNCLKEKWIFVQKIVSEMKRKRPYFLLFCIFVLFLSACDTEEVQYTKEVQKTPEPEIKEESTPIEGTVLYVLFSLNVHDWTHAEESIATLNKIVDIHEQYNVPIEIYLDDQVMQMYYEESPELVKRLRTSSVVAVSYHLRPPTPYYTGLEFDFIGLENLDETTLRETLLDYEEHAIDLETGEPTDEPGGYEFVKEVMGYAPLTVSGFEKFGKIGKIASDIYNEKGALFVVVHGKLCEEQLVVELGEKKDSLYARPSTVDVRLFESVGQDTATVLQEAEQEALQAGVSPVFMSIKMHEDDFYADGVSPWRSVYYEENEKGRMVPQKPPYDIAAADDVALLTEEDRDAIWQHYENAVAYVASREDFAAINAFDLKEMVE